MENVLVAQVCAHCMFNSFNFLLRYNRATNRKELKVQQTAAQALLDLSIATPPEESEEGLLEDKRDICSFKLSGNLKHGELKCNVDNNSEMNLNSELQTLRTESITLKQQLLNTQITQESFEGNDKKVLYLTGLPSYITLISLFNIIQPHMSDGFMSSLSAFHKFILVLMKLRLSTPVQDLAYRFGVSKSTVSRTFISTIHVMHKRLKSLIYWPAREQLRKTMPLQFRTSFGLKVAIIIECFEIFIERPSNLMARAQTWSQYKHHNTIKYLIGITPQGSVSFISKGWGGRTSDKYVTNNSGCLNKLLPGDVVLADRGFDIQESVGLMCAEVKIPSFTKGRKQLSAIDVESSRAIANVRIHVERVIGLLRNKYTILQDIVPIDYLITDAHSKPIIDKIVTVCCVDNLLRICSNK